MLHVRYLYRSIKQCNEIRSLRNNQNETTDPSINKTDVKENFLFEINIRKLGTKIAVGK